jgi:diguanylate cyclase (GGDEF)-like protein
MPEDTSMQQTREPGQPGPVSPTRLPYRRAGVFLAGMLLLLAATATYVVFRDRAEIWRSAHENALNVALGLESASSVVLSQTVISLRGIAKDLESPHPEERRHADSLRNAMRYDPVSFYLGIVDGDGTMTVVGRDGAPAAAVVHDVLAAKVQRPREPGLGVQALFQLPDDESRWFMPITLVPESGAVDGPYVFGLVSVRQMAAGADTLRLLPDSYATFATADGRRLVRYRKDSDTLEVGGPPLPEERLREMVAPRGSFEMHNSITGRPQLAGYAHSTALPLIVAAVMPTRGLYIQWLRESSGPVVVLLMGMAGVVVFGLRLQAALLRQSMFLAKEQYRADHDMLTRLLNRDAFMRRIDEAIAADPRRPFSIVLMDINNFKDINDTLGHAAGDEVLRITGRRMRTKLNEDGAIVARLGGDELGVFTRRTPTHEPLEALCQRLQDCLGEPIVLTGVELELAACMGAALFPEDARTASELLRCADIAMYAGKCDLRPCTRYVETMDQFAPEGLALKAEFAKALREGQLAVVYQPKVRLADGTLAGVEALARWEHPVRGPVPPGRFVPLAENSELVHPFTSFILETALAQSARWHALGHAVPVAVNVSVNNLLDHAFVEKVHAVLERLGVPPRLLELEVTESAVMRHPETVVKRLGALRELGVRLSIDDFGTGYASLSYLKRLPVHALKIDMSFILHMEQDEADQRIVRSATQLGHGFGMTVVAEGVESARAANLLLEYGCDFAQGYHFSRPLSPADLEAQWLARAPTVHEERQAARKVGSGQQA